MNAGAGGAEGYGQIEHSTCSTAAAVTLNSFEDMKISLSLTGLDQYIAKLILLYLLYSNNILGTYSSIRYDQSDP